MTDDAASGSVSESGAITVSELSTDAPERADPVERLRDRIRNTLRAVDWTVVSILAMAMIVGGALRLYDIGSLPLGFNQDEAVYSYDAWSIGQSGRDHLGHPVNLIGLETYGDWTPPVQTILLTPAARIFGLDVASLRAWNALIALLVVPLMYVLARLLFESRNAALLAAILIALNPWQIIQSRMIIPASIVPAVVVLLMLALAKSARWQSARWVIAAAIVAGMGLATYQALRGYVPMLLFAATVAWWRRYRAIGFGPLVVAALIFGFVALPTGIFMFLDESGSARMKDVSVFSDDSFYLPPDTIVDAEFVVEQYLDYFGPGFLLKEGGEYYPWVLPRDVGAIPIALSIALLIGTLALVARIVRPRDRWQREVCIFLLIALVCYPIPGAISLPSPAAPRAMHGLPVMILIATFGLLEVWRKAHSWPHVGSVRLRQGVVGIAGAGMALLLVAQTVQDMDAYFSNYAEETSYDFHYGIDGAIDFAVRNQAVYNEIWVAHVNEGYIYLLFDEQIDPAVAREEMTIRRHPGDYNWITDYGVFRFTSRVWVDPPPELDVASMQPVYQSVGPDGEVAYEVRTGTVPGHGLVMVIFKPQLMG